MIFFANTLRYLLLTHPRKTKAYKHLLRHPQPQFTRNKKWSVRLPAEITATSLTSTAVMVTAEFLIPLGPTARPAKGLWPVLVQLFLATVEFRFEFLLHLVSDSSIKQLPRPSFSLNSEVDSHVMSSRSPSCLAPSSQARCASIREGDIINQRV